MTLDQSDLTTGGVLPHLVTGGTFGSAAATLTPVILFARGPPAGFRHELPNRCLIYSD